MTTELQGTLILAAAIVTTGTLAVKLRTPVPVLSLAVRGLYWIARWFWCVASAADQALFSFRDEWRESRKYIPVLNESIWRAEHGREE